MQHKTKQILISVLAIIILVLLAIYLFKGFSQNSGDLSEADREAIIQALSDEPEIESLPEEEREQVIQALSDEPEENTLSEEERAQLLQALTDTE